MGALQELESIEIAVRSGKVAEAQRALKKLPARSISIHEKPKAAALAGGLPLRRLGVRWLFQLVYPYGRLVRNCAPPLLLGTAGVWYQPAPSLRDARFWSSLPSAASPR